MSEDLMGILFAVFFLLVVLVPVLLVGGQRPIGWKLFHKKYFSGLKSLVLKFNFVELSIEDVNNSDLIINESYLTLMKLCQQNGKTKHYSVSNSYSLLDAYVDRDHRFVFALGAQAIYTSEGTSYIQRLIFMKKGSSAQSENYYYSNGSTPDTHYNSELIPPDIKTVFDKLGQFYPYDTTVVGSSNAVIFTLPLKIEMRTLDIIKYLLNEGVNTLK